MSETGGNRTHNQVISDSMARFSRQWFRSGWKLARAFNAERKGDFGRAVQFIDEAGEITPLQSWFWVKRATLLLRLERREEAHRWFEHLRQQLEDSSSPERRYLYHYCSSMLALMEPESSQWSHHAKQANAIKCRWHVKGLIPMIADAEAEDSINSGRP